MHAVTYTVVIPCFNVAHYVRAAVESALAQTLPPLEIICVDDGSLDGTLGVLQSLRQAHPHLIRVIAQPHAGACAARNRGLEAARGEWIQEVLALSRRWYLQLIRDRLNLVFSLTQPAIWLAFFGSAVGRAIDRDVIGTPNYIGFMLPGVIAFTVVTNAVSGAMPLLWDKEVGYLDKILAMPIARSIAACGAAGHCRKGRQ
jgi:glycosyltransferase involved in cell wall biosynthesis